MLFRSYKRDPKQAATFKEEYEKCIEADFVVEGENYYLYYDSIRDEFCYGSNSTSRIIGVKYISKQDVDRLIEMSKEYKWKI